MTLSGERCVACRPGSPLATADEEAAILPQIPDWEIVETNGVRKLRRVYRFDSWMNGIKFADRIAAMAEDEDHHPTLTITWGKVAVTWWTHSIGGLHRNDFVMAARSDAAIN